MTTALGHAARSAACLLIPAMAAALQLSGCAAQPQQPPPEAAQPEQIPAEAVLEPGVRVALPEAHGIVPATFHQLLTIGYQGQTQQLQAVLEITPSAISLAGLTPAGIRMFSGHYDGTQVSVESGAGMEQLPPVTQVLLDIMLSLCPPDRFALPQGYVLQDRGWLRRELYAPDGRSVYAIAYDDALGSGRRLPVSISHQVFGYEVGFSYLPDPGSASDGSEDEAGADATQPGQGKPRRGWRFGRDLMGRPINQDGTVDYSRIRQRPRTPAGMPASGQLPLQPSLPAGLPGLMPGGQSTLQSFPMPTSGGE